MPTRPLVTSYEQDLRLFEDRWARAGLVLWTLVALAWPFVVTDRWVTTANLALTAVVGAVGLMILTGFAGQISLGHAAFLALGAYTSAILGEQFELPFWLAMPCAGAVAAAVGLAVGPFALRLRGLYLAIVTLGLLFLTNHVLHSLPELTHGVSGIPVRMYSGGTDAAGEALRFSAPWRLGSLELGFDEKLYFLFLALAAGAAWLGKNVARSNSGRAMMAVRDQDLAASVLGVHPARSKVLAFGVSSFLAGVAGSMFAYQQQYITIEPPFDLNLSVQYIAMIVLGGVGTVFGAVAGALLFVCLTPLMETVGGWIPFVADLSTHQRSTLMFAVVVCVLLAVEPLGLLGVWLRVKRTFAAWPFRY
ncbi:MAG: branched-chain amino acid ABC transporter permease [Planctomycetota bacterium]|jgi:branched-chain amino acid transport system permease protein|nr:branched-chain amino acid ABC transporter permease [Planctomycetota bacterium]MDP6764080.1 branched-chain amino acid ABC transporter permease [Planctomycetota bacterium]MDP6989796.1 branched-chain amino acid ABC transporter permease [Planctomycetota bacterium]